MAFNCDFNNITDNSAIFEASFTGGDANFNYWRAVRLKISDPQVSSEIMEMTIISSNRGSGSSNFTSLIRGLKAETEYSWNAELGYSFSNSDMKKIVWLGDDDGTSTSKYTAYGSFTTSADGTTPYFTASEMETEKYSITFYATFNYDSTIVPYISEPNKLTIEYTTDPSMQLDVRTLRFDSTDHEETGEDEGIYEWNNVKIEGLKAGKTYYWKAYCGPQSEAGEVLGYIIDKSTTLPPEPNALSLRILPISPSSADLTAVYYDAETSNLSDFSTLHYKFSTNDGRTWGSYRSCVGTVDDEHHFITFKDRVTGLTGDTEYLYRAYVGSEDPWG